MIYHIGDFKYSVKFYASVFSDPVQISFSSRVPRRLAYTTTVRIHKVHNTNLGCFPVFIISHQWSTAVTLEKIEMYSWVILVLTYSEDRHRTSSARSLCLYLFFMCGPLTQKRRSRYLVFLPRTLQYHQKWATSLCKDVCVSSGYDTYS